ncbi:PAS domain-containing protein [Mycobacterium sp. M1]|uniref:PAS domain-containing protein n=1 Tax=Mycolicibacter acidiphilus TaxID=2835306 RepID=A0ABS5RH33_9MYCO|nr:PAS domain-containing protein [Mycolicibacter acidiphilus]MBS9533489.1 PAS domain-containing protein [Mycolicibacter acidiphilus]
MTTLQELPAMVILGRIPVPVLAIAEDGTIVFANAAFADMTGYSRDDVATLQFHQLFVGSSDTDSPLDAMQAYANGVVSVAHRDGSTVRALMSKSALHRSEDRVVLAAFHDLTEQLWTSGDD